MVSAFQVEREEASKLKALSSIQPMVEVARAQAELTSGPLAVMPLKFCRYVTQIEAGEGKNSFIDCYS